MLLLMKNTLLLMQKCAISNVKTGYC